MGIQDFYTLLKNHNINPRVDILSNLRGKKVAIDANGWLHKMLYVSHSHNALSHDVRTGKPNVEITRKNLMQHLYNFLLVWLKNNITPVFIFDGKAPGQKKETQEKRIEKINKLREEINELENLIRENEHIELMPDTMTKLAKLYCNDYPPAYLEIPHIMEFLSELGIPVFQCKYEAEQLCCMLCIENKVYAVNSKDSDCFSYLCPRVIKEIGSQYKTSDNFITKRIEVFEIDKILEGLDLNHEQLVNLCIMMGCDYNSRIAGLGAVRCYDLIKQHNNIKNLPDKYDTTCYNYEWCLDNFKYTKSEELYDVENDKLELTKIKSLELLSFYNIRHNYQEYEHHHQETLEYKPGTKFVLPKKSVKVNTIKQITPIKV